MKEPYDAKGGPFRVRLWMKGGTTVKRTRVAQRSTTGGAPTGMTAVAFALLFAMVLLSAPIGAPAVEIAGTSSTY